MAGTIKAQLQLGDSATATQNFTLTSAAADGTMKIARGNVGATTQDILTVDINNKVSVNGLTASGDVQSASQNGGPLAGFRNRLINGEFRIDQRNNYANVVIGNGASAFVADRWLVNNQTDQSITATVVTTSNVTGISDTESRLRVVATTVAPTSGVVYISQKIERVDTLATSPTAFSAYMAGGVAEAVQMFLSQNFGSGGSTAVQGAVNGFNVTGSFVKYTALVTLASTVGKTVGARNNLEAVFAIYLRTTNAFSIAYAQLEPGSVATPFEFRPYAVELALCQRYYETFAATFSTTTRPYVDTFPYKVDKRSAPTLALIAGTANSATITGGVTATQSARALTAATVASDLVYSANAELL